MVSADSGNGRGINEPTPRPPGAGRCPKDIAAEKLAKLRARAEPRAPLVSGVASQPHVATCTEPTADPPRRPRADPRLAIEIGQARREIMARQFAHEFMTSGWDALKAYRSIARKHGAAKRLARRDLPNLKPGSRIVYRWFMASLPHIQSILTEQRERAGDTPRAAQAFLRLVLETSPATFLKSNGNGGVQFDIHQPHINDAQRSLITSMAVKNGVVTTIRTPDPTRAVEQMLKLRELELLGKTGQSDDSIAERIRQQFRRAKLLPLTSEDAKAPRTVDLIAPVTRAPR